MLRAILVCHPPSWNVAPIVISSARAWRAPCPSHISQASSPGLLMKQMCLGNVRIAIAGVGYTHSTQRLPLRAASATCLAQRRTPCSRLG